MEPRLRQRNRAYMPVYTEAEGLYKMGLGVGMMGYCSYVKLKKRNEAKFVIPFITDDSTSFFYEAGKEAFKEGFKQILPTTGCVLAIYLIGMMIFKPESN